MKKFLFIFCSFFIIGCSKGSKDVLNSIKKGIDALNTYTINGELNLHQGENTYTYDVTVDFKQKDHYRVSLVNKVNNHEQIILRNNDGVYVLTPSLNKSFKFQSDWPYNNSQIYILERIINDIKSDEERIYETKDNMHIYTTKVNYSTNVELVKQKVYFDKKYQLKKVEVYDNKDAIMMDFSVSDFETNNRLDDDIFELDSNMDLSETSNVSKTIEDIIYPMYLPSNTYLASQDKISTNNGERVILTFGGDTSFTIIEETVAVSKDIDTNVVYGEPDIIIDTVGSINEYSINWVSNGIEYSLVSDNLDKKEMINVAKSISSSSITK